MSTSRSPEDRAPSAPKASVRGRWVKFGFVAVLATGLLYACRGEKTYRWEEEVVLSSGERLVLERSVRLEKISAPFNPFQTNWAWRESAFTVTEGPADVKGARYEAWLLPMLIERDVGSRQFVVIGIPVNCDAYKAHSPDRGWVYLAFRLVPGQQMQQTPIPDWAWGRRLNLLMPNEDKPPPGRVAAEFADRFNREESRGESDYFVVRSDTPVHCR